MTDKFQSWMSKEFVNHEHFLGTDNHKMDTDEVPDQWLRLNEMRVRGLRESYEKPSKSIQNGL